MKYPLFKVHINVASAMKNIKKVLQSGFINEGKQVTELQEELQRRFETQNLVLLNSCTSAITLALRLCDIRESKGHAEVRYDVATSPMTCVASNCPILNEKSNITWVDIDAQTGCMDVNDLQRKLEGSDLIKAVIVVAWAGIPPELERLYDLCKKFNVPLILDAAHAYDARFNGKHVHEFADYTCYSFQAIKHFTTGDGGMLICSDQEKHLQAKKLKWFGIDRDGTKDVEGNWKGQRWEIDIEDAGYKFAMNNLTAALGLSQVKHIDKILSKHRWNAGIYENEFRDSKYVMSLKTPAGSEPSCWVHSMLVKEGINREQLCKRLNEEGIETGMVHIANDVYSCFKQFKADLPGVRDFSNNHFAIPVGWWLNDDDIVHIVKRVNQICEEIYVA